MTLICTAASLKVPAMIVYDVSTKVLDTEIFPQHTIADVSIWHYIYSFVQSGEPYTVKQNKKNTHTAAAVVAATAAAAAALSSFHDKTENQVILGKTCLCVNPCDMVLIGILG